MAEPRTHREHDPENDPHFDHSHDYDTAHERPHISTPQHTTGRDLQILRELLRAADELPEKKEYIPAPVATEVKVKPGLIGQITLIGQLITIVAVISGVFIQIHNWTTSIELLKQKLEFSIKQNEYRINNLEDAVFGERRRARHNLDENRVNGSGSGGSSSGD